MPTTDGNEGRIRRRRVNARRGMAFSGNSMSNASSGDDVAEDDVADINAEVEQAASTPAVVIPPRPGATFPSPDAASPEGFSPSERLKQVGRRSSEYEREYRLQLLHRMLMRGVPLDEIASSLGLSVSQVMRDRKELYSRLRQESKELDIDLIVGGSKGTYEEMLALAMRIASKNDAPAAIRLAAMRTGLAAENDKHRMLQAAGVYDVLRYRRAAGDGQLTDIQRLLHMTEEMLNDIDKGVSFRDKDSDRSDDETIDL